MNDLFMEKPGRRGGGDVMWPWEKLFTCVKEAICFRFVCCGTWGETLPRMTKLAASNKSNTGRMGFEPTEC